MQDFTLAMLITRSPILCNDCFCHYGDCFEGDFLFDADDGSDDHIAHQVVVQVRLDVRTVPSRVTNMSVHTNSVFAIGILIRMFFC